MIVLVVVLFMVDKPFLGVIPLFGLVLVNNYISKLEKKAEVDIKLKGISMICYFVTLIIGLVLIIWFSDFFQTGGF
ncbi:hypothetical protein ACIQZI_23935 [Peribacillus sp. NPDC096379]|uniref:hypothetical protein n=1 Tax=Peribacillus sp. NPDC096379 TaxID=3364393 RepID=UPI0038251193